MKLKIYINLRKQLSTLFTIILISCASLSFGQGSGEVINLGLYGGASTDFMWAYPTNRIFSAVETPASIFYSDDNCTNWTQPFASDSLEFYSGTTRRGWGGGAIRVLSNWNGWVAVETAEQAGTLTSSVVSFSNGDSSTYHTAYDAYLLNKYDPSFGINTSVSAIAISNSWIYVGITNALIRINDTSTYGSHNILLKLDTVTSNTKINWLAVSSSSTGYPVLIVANVPGNQYGKLYSFDGAAITEITGLPSTYGFERVFIHPADTSLDTLIVSALNKTANLRKLYRSLNGGTSWTDITPGGATTNWPLQNADYNPGWVTQMPNSNGLRLSYPNIQKSDDLGNTWSSGMLPDNAVATKPSDTSYVVGSKNKGPMLSTTGASGTFNSVDNVGHSAVRITKIAQKDTNIYYVATKAGLGYTNAYHNPAVTGIDQWRAPYGDFPITGVGNDAGVSSVAIDPINELHIIAGSTDGFYVSTTGPVGFSHVQPSDWNTAPHYDDMITDVKFITSDTVVAVSGTGSNRLPNVTNTYGNVWLSYDGGLTWTKSVPNDVDGGGTSVDYTQGNTIVVGYGITDTVIYSGTGYWDQNDPSSDGQLWKSTDLGTTWSFVNYGPTGLNGGATHMPIYDLDIYPDIDSTAVFYIASGENLDYAFCKTIDGGATYIYTNVAGEGAFSSVLVKLTNPEIVTVSARRRLFRYNSVLASTTLVFEGMPGEFVPDLETGSTMLGTTTGLYKLVEDPGSVTTVWNGTGNWDDDTYWSNGIPYDISNAIIVSGNVSVNISGKSYDLDINSQADLTISTGKSLTVGGNFTLNSDANGYASFIDDGSLTVTGTVKVERYITADSWHYITPPISNAKASVFMGLWLDYWDEPAGVWTPITAPTDDLLAGKGYKTWSSSGTTGDVTLEFAGTLNTGDFSPTITLSGSPATMGWNLVGNYFPSAIDWGTENNPIPGFNRTNIDSTIYFWTGSQYATYNPTGDGTGTNGGTQYIASMQGFYIHANATNPALTIPQGSRVHNALAFRNTSNVDQSLSLTVHSTSYSDEIIIRVNDNATAGFDTQYDAYKLYGIQSAPQLYDITDNEILTVNNLPMVDHKIDAHLGFIPGTEETHTIVANGIDSFNDAVVLSLEDLQEGITINLRTDSVYSYFASPGDDPNRFILHIDAGIVGVQDFDKPKENLIYMWYDKIVVENANEEEISGRINVYDVLGRLQFSSKLNRTSRQVLNPRLRTGTYIVVLSNNSDIQSKVLLKY